MSDQVTPKVIHDRARVVREIAQEKNLDFRRSFFGKTLKAITLAKEEQLGESIVLTENYIQVSAPANGIPPNRLVDVQIDAVDPHFTRGILSTASAGFTQPK